MADKKFGPWIKKCPGKSCGTVSADFEMTVTSTSTPAFDSDAVVNITDNGDGTYLVQADGATYVKFKDDASSKDVTEITVHKTNNIKDMSYMFYPPSSNNMSNLTNITFEDTIDTSDVIHMNNMFKASLFTSLDVSNFDTSNVTTIRSMFHELPSLTSIDISNFNTSNITEMHYLFYNCDNLKYIKMPDDIDTTKPSANMNSIFRECSSLKCITKIDTTNATDTVYMYGAIRHNEQSKSTLY